MPGKAGQLDDEPLPTMLKPGFLSREDEAKKKFAADVIKALKQREARQEAPPASALAKSAYRKMQFDFPDVTVEEIEALASVYEDAASSKKLCDEFPLTTPLVLGMVEAIKLKSAATETAPKSSKAGPQGVELKASTSHGPTSTGGGANEEGAARNTLCEAYQRLASAVLVRTLEILLKHGEKTQATHLKGYAGPEDDAKGGGELTEYFELPDEAPPVPDVEAYAASSDGSDFEFEPMGLMMGGAMSTHGAPMPPPGVDGAGPRVPPPPARPEPPPEEKLAHLAGLLRYDLVRAPQLWEDRSLMQCVARIAAATRASAPSVSAPMVGCLIDRLVDSPQSLEALPSLLQTLGFTEPALAGETPRSLLGAAAGGLSLAAALAARLRSGDEGATALWRALDGDVLKALSLVLEHLAHAKSDDEAAVLQPLTLASAVLEFFLLAAPRGGAPGPKVKEAGCLRPLAQLYLRFGTHASAEPMRRAVLLASASSTPNAKWLLAVPGFEAVCDDPALPELHAALWPAVRTRGVAGAPAPEALMALLDEDAAVTPLGIVRAHTTLQLLHDVFKAAGRRPVWPAAVQKKLAALLPRFRTLDTSADAQQLPSDAEAGNPQLRGDVEPAEHRPNHPFARPEPISERLGDRGGGGRAEPAAASFPDRVEAADAGREATGQPLQATATEGQDAAGRAEAAASAQEAAASAQEAAAPAQEAAASAQEAAEKDTGACDGDGGEADGGGVEAAGGREGDDAQARDVRAEAKPRGPATAEQLERKKAEQLRPRCVRLLKDLVATKGAAGKSD